MRGAGLCWGRVDFESEAATLERHLSSPEVLVTSNFFYQLFGTRSPVSWSPT